jgi:ketosteroid isomerase-like protein
MTRLPLLALLFPFAALAAQSATTRKSIESVNARYTAAFNKGDVAEFVKVYSADGTAMPPNGTAVHGRAALAEWWQGGWEAGVRNIRLTTLEVFPHGNEATEIGRYQIDLQSPEGATVGGDQGKYIVLWKRDPQGQWKWHRDIYNSDLPLTPPAGAAPGAGGISRAGPGDSVWVVLNTVRPEQRAGFEEFTRLFWRAGLSTSDAAIRREFLQTRVLVPTKAEPDGSYSYGFLMDPPISGASYSVDSLARRILPAAEAARISALYLNSQVGPPRVALMTEATRVALGTP